MSPYAAPDLNDLKKKLQKTSVKGKTCPNKLSNLK
jgi:hypothetical protein